MRGPLHGIPVLLKDNIDIAGLVNSAGSLALATHNRPQQDAFLVGRARVGRRDDPRAKRTSASGRTFARRSRRPAGAAAAGRRSNPYVLDRNPCGSSAGTGAAIAASLATVGVGTETDGSIICPAAVNGLVGLKPTVGLVSRNGIIPISISQDTAGPMGRTVADVAALLDGADVAWTRPIRPVPRPKRHIAPDYLRVPEPDASKGKRFGLLRKAMGYHADVDAAVERAVATLTAAGAVVVDVEIAGNGRWEAPETRVLLYEFKDGLNTYLKSAARRRRRSKR